MNAAFQAFHNIELERMDLTETFRFRLNGKLVSVNAPPAYTLLEALRERLHVTGPKEDCAKGECGSCTIIMNGLPICSCLVLVAQAEGADIVTSEGLARDGKLNSVQEAFVEEGGVQCGHCIPGMVVSASALLIRNPTPTEDEIKTALAGNLCRCTGYTKIIAAVQKASGKRRIKLH